MKMEELKLLLNTKEEIKKIKENLILLIEERLNLKLDEVLKTLINEKINTISKLNTSILIYEISRDLSDN